MAITVDAVSYKQNDTSSVNTISWDHTCSADADILIVCVPESRAVSVSSITYDEDSLTLSVSKSYNNSRAFIYYITNPSSGTNTITVTMSANNGSYQAAAVSLEGVNETSPIGATNTKSGSATDKTITITTTQANSYLVDCMGTISGRHTEGIGQTNLFAGGSGGTNRRASYKGVSAAEEYTMSWTINPADGAANYSYVVIEVKEAISTTDTSNFFLMF
jgi:VCBS repeat-containing protein